MRRPERVRDAAVAQLASRNTHRMPFHCKLPVRLLDFSVRRSPLQAKDAIEVLSATASHVVV